jgi:16S rRNA (guanine527-N7)-methyltransferase
MLAAMDADRIAALLQPFLGGEPLSPKLAAQLQAYLDLLLRWNARINLTSVRDPEQIVTRHFGESLFTARALFENGVLTTRLGLPITLADVGSGAGFPGIPIKLVASGVQLTLIESQNKKATFLGEAVRTLGIEAVEVFCGRAEDWNNRATVVTMRAVEKLEKVLPIAASLVDESGMLCLLLGASQARPVQQILGSKWQFELPVPIPQSDERVVVMGKRIASRV